MSCILRRFTPLAWALAIAFSTSAAQAGLILGDFGSTQPKNLVPPPGSGLQGIVNAASYILNAGAPAADPYGSGFSTAALIAAGFADAGVDKFLYLYQTDNTGTVSISENTVAWDPALGGGVSFGQLIHTTFVPNPLSPLTVPANPSPFTPGVAGAVGAADAAAVTVGLLNAGPSSLQAINLGAGLLPGAHSDLWGYTSRFPPRMDNTGIQDHGTNAQGLVPTAAVPEPSALALLGMGILAMAGFGWRRGLAA